MLIKSATERGIDMEFSHIENDTVYVKGTEKDKSDILVLINNFKDSYNTYASSYASVEPETIEQVKIDNSGDTLALSKGDLSTIFCVLGAMRSLSYDTERLCGISEEKFLVLDKDIDDIHLITFGSPET